MKLFAVVYEGDPQDKALITLKINKPSKQVLNRPKHRFFFDLNFNTKPFKLSNTDAVVHVRRSIKFKAPFSFNFKKTNYLKEYSFIHQSDSDLKGFVKEKDIREKDAAIVSLYKYEPKEFTVRD